MTISLCARPLAAEKPDHGGLAPSVTREMAGLVELNCLGAILPKTITKEPRAGNFWRTVETTGGMLNSIGLTTTASRHSSSIICRA
jgi:dihydroorotate dehydrogenase